MGPKKTTSSSGPDPSGGAYNTFSTRGDFESLSLPTQTSVARVHQTGGLTSGPTNNSSLSRSSSSLDGALGPSYMASSATPATTPRYDRASPHGQYYNGGAYGSGTSAPRAPTDPYAGSTYAHSSEYPQVASAGASPITSLPSYPPGYGNYNSSRNSVSSHHASAPANAYSDTGFPMVPAHASPSPSSGGSYVSSSQLPPRTPSGSTSKSAYPTSSTQGGSGYYT
jgi:hypothetical protein